MRREAGLTGDGGHHFSHLQPVQDGGLPRSVQPQDQYPHLLSPPQACEETGEEASWREGRGEGMVW